MVIVFVPKTWGCWTPLPNGRTSRHIHGGDPNYLRPSWDDPPGGDYRSVASHCWISGISFDSCGSSCLGSSYHACLWVWNSGDFRGVCRGKDGFWYIYVGEKNNFSHQKVINFEPRNIWVKNCRCYRVGREPNVYMYIYTPSSNTLSSFFFHYCVPFLMIQSMWVSPPERLDSQETKIRKFLCGTFPKKSHFFKTFKSPQTNMGQADSPNTSAYFWKITIKK